MKFGVVECKLEVPLPEVDLAGIAEEVEEQVDDIYDYRKFAAAVRSLKTEGVSVVEICKTIGIPRRCLYYWLTGSKRPYDPYYFLMVRRWDQAVQENRRRVEAEFETARKTKNYRDTVL